MRGSGSTEEYKKHAESVYQKSRKSINYDIINKWLRSNDFHDTDTRLDILEKDKDPVIRRIVSVVKNLDYYTQSNRNKKSRSMFVYRGISPKRYEFAKDTGALVNLSFMSTSRSEIIAREFGPVILKINVPPHIGVYSLANQGEQEMLIERNTQCVMFKTPVYNKLLGEKDGKAIKCDLFVECTLAKYNPATDVEMKTIRKNMDSVRKDYMKQIIDEDEEIDWDNI